MLARHGFIAVLGLAALVPGTAAADTEVDSSTIASNTNNHATAPDRTAAATSVKSSLAVEVKEPAYDGLQVLIDEEARAAMAKGDFPRARYLFWRLLEIDPEDARALREAARVAQAMGDLEFSVDAFQRVEIMTGGKPDPELHYLRGEALDALGRRKEAEAEWQKAERQLSHKPLDRQGKLWMARIAALRKELPRSLELYDSMMPDDPYSSDHANLVILKTEAYILSKKWKQAEQELRALLALHEGHTRGEALLAWVLEARRNNVAAADLRAAFAGEWVDVSRKTVEYARALERIHDPGAALAHYREARELGVPDLDRDIDRMRGRVAPELAAGFVTRGDPSGTITGYTAGANLPLGTRKRLAVSGVQETSTGGGMLGDDTTTSGSLWALFSDKDGDRLGFGGSARSSGRGGYGMGASAWLATSQDRTFQLQVRGDYGQPWRESATTIREGGVFDAAQAVGYARALDGKLLVSGGVQGRRLGLAPEMGVPSVHAVQMLGIAGVDYQLFSSATRLARGEILNEEMLAPRSLSSALVLSYRHYELTGDNPFAERVFLVQRSSVDEVSATASHVLDRSGRLAGEVRGGLGYDWARDGRRYRAGGSLMLSLTRGSRFTLDYDFASESTTGLVGNRHFGSAVLHVDL